MRDDVWWTHDWRTWLGLIRELLRSWFINLGYRGSNDAGGCSRYRLRIGKRQIWTNRDLGDCGSNWCNILGWLYRSWGGLNCNLIISFCWWKSCGLTGNGQCLLSWWLLWWHLWCRDSNSLTLLSTTASLILGWCRSCRLSRLLSTCCCCNR